MHRHFASRFSSLLPALHHLAPQLPENPSVVGAAKALAAAHCLYPSPSQLSQQRQTVVVMVVQPGELNTADQRHLEYQLLSAHAVPLVRMTLAEIRATARLDEGGVEHEQCPHLLLPGGEVASVVYFRAGYTPKDFPTAAEWEALHLIESSAAVRCPTVPYHLSGSKKIQQVLAAPGMVERFLDAAASARVRSCFTRLWGLEDDGEAARLLELVRASPDEFVLKPQREGGGNNLWGREMLDFLATASRPQRAAFILMARIRPPSQPTAYLRDGVVSTAECISELGVYSNYLGDGRVVHLSEVAGHLLRTKPAHVNEGGVAAGFAGLDSPLPL
jgi:glutathione synthetase